MTTEARGKVVTQKYGGILVDTDTTDGTADQLLHELINPQSTQHSTPVFILTSSTIEDRQNYLEQGATAVFSKPFDINFVQETVTNALTPSPKKPGDV